MRLLIIALFFSLISCATIGKGYQNNNVKIQKRAGQNINQSNTKYTPDEYIDRFSTIAVRKMIEYGIPASITLAQGILESGAGNSDLAKFANNHFGIKCTTDWKGLVYYKDDDRKNDCFRVYDNPDLSFEDHSKFLQRPRYKSLFLLASTDYQSWAYGLKNAGYATLPEYPELLIGIIEKYNLQRFDVAATAVEEKVEKRDSISIIQRADTMVVEPKPAPISELEPAQLSHFTYMVAEGDTLYGISRKFEVSIETLIEDNKLGATNISIGQVLSIRKK